ncbi:MAG: hypothetical protein BroJett011_15090 [Chloroflexota bacterium]|nr:MAG: hypothetical protein BroJett011_15090 [Chloroflexota bacterium]
MNEQQLADLFSEQLDRLLTGEAIDLPAEAGDVPELLQIIGQPTTQTHFQASPAAQAAFQSQLAGWFGIIANGGAPMAILGLSKVWFISIVVAVITVITGAGIIAVITTSIFISRSGPIVQVPTKTPTPQGTLAVTASPVASTTVTPAGTPTVISTPVPTAVITGTPSLTPVVGLPPLVFIGTWQIPRLCAGVYTTQSSLVSVGNAPIDNAALAWEVIEGVELVDTVGFDSANLVAVGDDSAATGADDTAIAARSDPLVGVVDFQPISVEQKVKLDVKVKVKEDWWKHESKTEIKIKLSVKNKFDLQPHPGPASYSQIITIVRQDAQWVTLTGFPHNVGENKMLVDGRIVIVNSCTGLPINWPPGSKIRVVGWLQPDGTFIAINIIVININVITGDFDSGVPLPGGGGSSGGGDGGSRGGGGGGGGGSKGGGGGSGGSKGGSK